LIQGHEPTTIAVLIGSAASKIGSADPFLSKTISLHLPALLPAQHVDIEISPLVQAAALVGLGLLHCASGHRLMSEFLLSELSRRTQSDRCDSREALLLAAAWALGMVLLGKGSRTLSSREEVVDSRKEAVSNLRSSRRVAAAYSSDALRGLADLRIEDRLLQQIDGGKRASADSPLFPINSCVDLSSKSSRVLEGEDINTNITAPGAIIALSLIYIRSNNTEILQRLRIPQTAVALDLLRPDLLIYRAMGLCLVQWDQVHPSEDWIRGHIPELITRAAFPSPSPSCDPEAHYSRLSANAPELSPKVGFALYLCSMSGFCYGIGIVFAGTADQLALKTLTTFLKTLQGCVCDYVA
jgi:anaphase-promoting complex subunit 1